MLWGAAFTPTIHQAAWRTASRKPGSRCKVLGNSISASDLHSSGSSCVLLDVDIRPLHGLLLAVTLFGHRECLQRRQPSCQSEKMTPVV
jgi:hypothetical protein